MVGHVHRLDLGILVPVDLDTLGQYVKIVKYFLIYFKKYFNGKI